MPSIEAVQDDVDEDRQAHQRGEGERQPAAGIIEERHASTPPVAGQRRRPAPAAP